MNFNVKLIKLLNTWFYNDITKIILSYKTLDIEILLCDFDIKIDVYDIFVIGRKLYLISNNKTKIYFDLISKEIFTDVEMKPTNNKISKNLLCEYEFRLYDKEKEIFNLPYVRKLEIYKNSIYYEIDNSIYKLNIEESLNTIIVYKSNFDSKNIDFDIYENKFYIFDPYKIKLSLYEIWIIIALIF